LVGTCAEAVGISTHFQKFLKVKETFFKKFPFGCRAEPWKKGLGNVQGRALHKRFW